MCDRCDLIVASLTKQAAGHLPVRLAGREQAEDLDLAFGELGAGPPYQPGGAADLVNADGLVQSGDLLWVVRNFSRVLTTLELSSDGRTAQLVSAIPTDPSRVLTTATLAQGRLLLVDSKFDEPTAQPPYEVSSWPPPGRTTSPKPAV